MVAPKNKDPPMAKFDEHGNFITSKEPLKKLYIDTFTKRLENCEIAEGMDDIRELKEELWHKRLKHAKTVKTPDWDIEKLNVILKSLKLNKARDHNGLVNEIFRPNVAGLDLRISLLKLMNKIKTTQIITQY